MVRIDGHPHNQKESNQPKEFGVPYGIALLALVKRQGNVNYTHNDFDP